MAQDIQAGALQKTATPQHFAPPSAREMRAQAVHRLQVGLLGLCAMLLIVVLANIVMDRARLAEPENPVAEKTPAEDQQVKAAVDPLADMGVVPAAGPSPSASPKAPAPRRGTGE